MRLRKRQIKRRPEISAHFQTGAERLHNGGVTWLGGSGHHFRRFDPAALAASAVRLLATSSKEAGTVRIVKVYGCAELSDDCRA